MDVIVSGKLNLQTRMVLEWQLLTMTRPLEAARARWDQIDFSHSTWTISGELMKMSRDHVVVLCKQALQVLEVMKFVSNGSEFVFPHRSDLKMRMNSQSANDGLKKNGLQDRMTAHGMRALASTTLNEAGFESELVEIALSHVDKNTVRAVYNRSQYVERRRYMMKWWGDHVEAAIGKTAASVALKMRDLKIGC